MTLTEQVTKRIIRRLLNSQDYRIEIVKLINEEFLQFAIEFFKKIVEAKLGNTKVTPDWYKSAFLDSELDKGDIAIYSGLNEKTIQNMYNTTKKEIVIDVAKEHYDSLYTEINALVETESGLDLTLTIKFNKVSVDLNINESLIVINALAVKRAAFRGGLWSAVGKAVEKPLMETLCRLYSVPEKNYTSNTTTGKAREILEREVDFYLINDSGNQKCEVKLMGKGNPESADAVFARGSKVFVADKLSKRNKAQLTDRNVAWVALRDQRGFEKFADVLQALGIPHGKLGAGNLDEQIDSALRDIFGD